MNVLSTDKFNFQSFHRFCLIQDKFWKNVLELGLFSRALHNPIKDKKIKRSLIWRDKIMNEYLTNHMFFNKSVMSAIKGIYLFRHKI